MRQAIKVGRWALVCLTVGVVLIPQSSHAQDPALIQFDTQLTAMSYSGGPFLLPLASDPGNFLGDSIDGYGFVQSLVTVTLSSQRGVNPGPASPGGTCAVQQLNPTSTIGVSAYGPIASRKMVCGEPAQAIELIPLEGELFFVDSFFDVFFDITFTDADPRPGRDYAGMPDGASLVLVDIGPVSISSSYFAVFDQNAPNFGLFPPFEASPYVGFSLIEIPLGGDINGNGENDKIKFTIGKISVGDENRFFTTLPDDSVINQWDAGMSLEGAVVDESADPPFTIGASTPGGLPDPSAFGGPTTARSNLLNEIAVPVDGVSWGTVKSQYRGGN